MWGVGEMILLYTATLAARQMLRAYILLNFTRLQRTFYRPRSVSWRRLVFPNNILNRTRGAFNSADVLRTRARNGRSVAINFRQETKLIGSSSLAECAYAVVAHGVIVS